VAESTELGFLKGSTGLPTRPPNAAGVKDIISKSGKLPMSFGKKLLYGTGVLGNLLMAYELIAGLSGAAQSSQRNMAASRSGYGGRLEESLGNLLGGDRMGVSNEAVRVAMTKDRPSSITPELMEIIKDSDMKELLKARHQPKPSVKEAYARAGLL
tara:strand:+ start:54 stop:521 length:468 start_codon:yes stop_codon:yes gene_type:complete